MTSNIVIRQPCYVQKATLEIHLLRRSQIIKAAKQLSKLDGLGNVVARLWSVETGWWHSLDLVVTRSFEFSGSIWVTANSVLKEHTEIGFASKDLGKLENNPLEEQFNLHNIGFLCVCDTCDEARKAPRPRFSLLELDESL